MLPPRPTLAGHLVILWLLQSVTVLGYRSSDPEHITAILGQTVLYCTVLYCTVYCIVLYYNVL